MCKAAASIFDPIRNACKRKPSEMSQKVEASDNGRPKWWLDAPVTAEKKLEWLVSERIGNALLGREGSDPDLGFQRYLGFGSTHIEKDGIGNNTLCVYKKKNTYCITTNDKADKYNKEGFSLIKKEDMNNKLIKDLNDAIEKKLDNITWDLPKIHAIRTVGKSGIPERLRLSNQTNETIEQNPDNPKEMPEVLITYAEAEVKTMEEHEKLDHREDKNGTKIGTGPESKIGKGWKAVLPWTVDGIDLNYDQKDYNEQKEFHENYKNFSGQKTFLSKQWIICKNILEKLYLKFPTENRESLKDLYQSTRRLLRGRLAASNNDNNANENLHQESCKCIIAVENLIAENNSWNVLLGDDLREFKSLIGEQETRKAIKVKIDSLGFKDELNGKTIQFDIEGGLYRPVFGFEPIHIANEKQNDDVGVCAYDMKLQDIATKLPQAKLDLKVYVIETENGGILITDKEDSAKGAIANNNNKMAFPGMQTGIELSSDTNKMEEQRKIYEGCKRLQNEPSKKLTWEALQLCDEIFGQLYWNNLTDQDKATLGNGYQKLQDALKKNANENNDSLLEDIKAFGKVLHPYCNTNIKPQDLGKLTLLVQPAAQEEVRQQTDASSPGSRESLIDTQPVNNPSADTPSFAEWVGGEKRPSSSGAGAGSASSEEFTFQRPTESKDESPGGARSEKGEDESPYASGHSETKSSSEEHQENKSSQEVPGSSNPEVPNVSGHSETQSSSEEQRRADGIDGENIDQTQVKHLGTPKFLFVPSGSTGPGVSWDDLFSESSLIEKINEKFKKFDWEPDAKKLLINKVEECLKIAGLVTDLNAPIADNQPVKDYINSFIDNLDLGHIYSVPVYDEITEGTLKNKFKCKVPGSGMNCLIRALLVAAGHDMGTEYSKERIKFECIVSYVGIKCKKSGKSDMNDMNEVKEVISTLRKLTINSRYVIHPEYNIVVYEVEKGSKYNRVEVPSSINQHADELYEITHEGRGDYRSVL
jgi:hypothetical protein